MNREIKKFLVFVLICLIFKIGNNITNYQIILLYFLFSIYCDISDLLERS